MIELVPVRDGSVELAGYSPGSSLQELVDAVSRSLEADAACTRCAACCRDVVPLNGLELPRFLAREGAVAMPGRPDLAARRRGIEDLERTLGLSRRAATLLYEYNNAAAACLAKAAGGSCVFNAGGPCGIYAERPLVCRLYHCRAGSRLAALGETIVSQGTWHAYHVLGWIDAEEIEHNPFLGARSLADVPLAGFDGEPEEAEGDAAYLL